MGISIKNWTDGQVTNCRLAIVKGVVYTDSERISDDYEIAVTNGSSVGHWPVLNGEFKAVVELNKGENAISFNFKLQSASLRLRFVANATDRSVVPLYVVCDGHDGRFQAPPDCDNSVESACRRIALSVHLVQSLYAEKLLEHGFERKTFQVLNDLDQKSPCCQVFLSRLDVSEARRLDQEALWEFIGREIMTSPIGSNLKKYIAILSCTFWNGSEVLADPALGGGGLALLGSGTLHTWPESLSELTRCFTDQTKMPPNLLDNSCFRGTFGGCFSTSLGSICHEVGHMFNLGHTPTGIMARGFDNVERVFLSVASPKVTGCDTVNETNHLILVPNIAVTTDQIPSVTLEPAATAVSETDDLTSFTTSCATILAHHQWFNCRTPETSTIIYDSLRNLVSSDVGLKVVQLRGPCGAVIKSWELGRKSPHKHLILPRLKVSPATLVAIDSYGFVLTQQI